ncbi:hypothetical protein CGZ92_12935 [Parenemella sanctibonifatiensis]|uniref:8-amino-7-oxononanoate synthase n=1 Tax=Parenemella sanctibonifatiensis TaxID=2016505 RepID=A0A255E5G9_9ACTN|nr:hypothetical protein CGZ92_12935 [Parenemella sanctibonifatiensis]
MGGVDPGEFGYVARDLAVVERTLVEDVEQVIRDRCVHTASVATVESEHASAGQGCPGAGADIHQGAHAVGFIGGTGAGTPEMFGVQDRVDILTGTFGKALGGASGGYTSGRQAIVDLLRQRSRPYLFSNSVAPMIVAATAAALDLLADSGQLLAQLRENTAYFRSEMTRRGFEIPVSEHPIVPVMVGDAATAARMADQILAAGVYVRAFSYPVVPEGKARIRTQLSAAHTRADLDRAIGAFEAAREAVTGS